MEINAQSANVDRGKLLRTTASWYLHAGRDGSQRPPMARAHTNDALSGRCARHRRSAIWAMLVAIDGHNKRASEEHKIKSVLCTGLCTGVGQMPESESARQMAMAWSHYLNRVPLDRLERQAAQEIAERKAAHERRKARDPEYEEVWDPSLEHYLFDWAIAQKIHRDVGAGGTNGVLSWLRDEMPDVFEEHVKPLLDNPRPKVAPASASASAASCASGSATAAVSVPVTVTAPFASSATESKGAAKPASAVCVSPSATALQTTTDTPVSASAAAAPSIAVLTRRFGSIALPVTEALTVFSLDLVGVVCSYACFPTATSTTRADRKIEHLLTFGSAGTADGQFEDAAQAIATCPVTNNIWIGSAKRVQIFDENGRFLRHAKTDFQSQWQQPSDIAFAPNGDAYVADSHAHCITVCRPDGSFVRNIGQRGSGNGQFLYPRCIDIHMEFQSEGASKEGLLFVCDSSRRVQALKLAAAADDSHDSAADNGSFAFVFEMQVAGVVGIAVNPSKREVVVADGHLYMIHVRLRTRFLPFSVFIAFSFAFCVVPVFVPLSELMMWCVVSF